MGKHLISIGTWEIPVPIGTWDIPVPVGTWDIPVPIIKESLNYL